MLKAVAEDNASNLAAENITVIGVVPEGIKTGLHFIARGQWQTHPKFGKQFKAFSITETEPTSSLAIEKYLSSGIVKGFGPVLAQRVVAKFAEKTLDIIDQEPHRLRSVEGIGEKKLEEIIASWQQKKSLREVLLFFQNHNISMSLAQRIYGTYKERAVEVVSDNPYILSKDIWGVGFQTADIIAKALGIKNDSHERVAAGLSYILKKAIDDGNCFLPEEILIDKTLNLLELRDEELCKSALLKMCLEADVVKEGNNYYQPYLNLAENQLAKLICSRIRWNSSIEKAIDPILIEKACSAAITLNNGEIIQLSEQQKDAIRLSCSNTLTVITGGPGCGKTTVVKNISNLFQQAGLEVKLAAPTGRAAQRLSEVCDLPASTIHRLLKFDPISGKFTFNADNKLTAQALIIDESSMIDVTLAQSLFSAVSDNTHLIIVGDADQLPSVGPGLFLADLLNIEAIPRVRLSTLFRRSSESLINQVAYQINSAIVPELPEPDGKNKSDVYFLNAKTSSDVLNLVEKLVTEQIPKHFGFQGQDILVLSPMNQGEIGIINLNQQLQKRILPNTLGAPSLKVGNLEFMLGDRICQRANNYQITDAGVFNGDQGQVIGVDAENRTLTIKFWDGREILYKDDDLFQLDLAYALTIHRSQGSESQVVIVIMHESHSILLERQLFYTAVTRAKKVLMIVGTKTAVVLATRKSRSKKRFTALSEKINNIIDISIK